MTVRDRELAALAEVTGQVIELTPARAASPSCTSRRTP
jgi:hypothetical protein